MDSRQMTDYQSGYAAGRKSEAGLSEARRESLAKQNAKIERLDAEMVILINGSEACASFVAAHPKEQKKWDSYGSDLLSDAKMILKKEGGSTPWLTDMIHGSIDKMKEGVQEGMEAAEKAAKEADTRDCYPGEDLTIVAWNKCRKDIARVIVEAIRAPAKEQTDGT